MIDQHTKVVEVLIGKEIETALLSLKNLKYGTSNLTYTWCSQKKSTTTWPC